MAFVAAISAAGGSTLIANGAMSPAPIVKTDFADYVESLPAFAVIALMACTYNIGIGIAAGFILDALCKPRRVQSGKSGPDYCLWPNYRSFSFSSSRTTD